MKKTFLCDKLVRDRVQQLNNEQGNEGVYRVIGAAERSTYAKKKVLEEAQEVVEEINHKNIPHALSELADVIQAAQALLEIKNQDHSDLFSSSILATFLEKKHTPDQQKDVAFQLLQNAETLQESASQCTERDVVNICFAAIRLAQCLGYSIEALKQEFLRKQQEKGTFQTWTCLSQITLPENHPKFQSYIQRYPVLDTE